MQAPGYLADIDSEPTCEHVAVVAVLPGYLGIGRTDVSGCRPHGWRCCQARHTDLKMQADALARSIVPFLDDPMSAGRAA